MHVASDLLEFPQYWDVGRSLYRSAASFDARRFAPQFVGREFCKKLDVVRRGREH
jgi:hypothetical protein